MGKYRGHQDKSRRGREKKLLKKKVAAAGGSGDAQLETADSPGRPQQQKQPQLGNTEAGGKAAAAGAKRKLKHVTYAKENSVLICGDGDFSFTRGVIRHRGTGCVSTSSSWAHVHMTIFFPYKFNSLRIFVLSSQTILGRGSEVVKHSSSRYFFKDFGT